MVEVFIKASATMLFFPNSQLSCCQTNKIKGANSYFRMIDLQINLVIYKDVKHSYIGLFKI